jgi:hypothetical protein
MVDCSCLLNRSRNALTLLGADIPKILVSHAVLDHRNWPIAVNLALLILNTASALREGPFTT